MMSTLAVFAFVASAAAFFSWVAARSPQGLADDLREGTTRSVEPGEPFMRLLALTFNVIAFPALISGVHDPSESRAIGWCLAVLCAQFLIVSISILCSAFDRYMSTHPFLTASHPTAEVTS